MDYKLIDNADTELIPVDFYTRELHFAGKKVHIKSYNPLSDIFEYERCVYMYNANYKNLKYDGYTIDNNGNDALVDIIDPDYKYPFKANENGSSKIINLGNTKLLEIIPTNTENHLVVNSRVKRVGYWSATNRVSRLFNTTQCMYIMAFKLSDSVSISLVKNSGEGAQRIGENFIGGFTNTSYGFSPKHFNEWQDLSNKYLVCFFLGAIHVSSNKSFWVLYDENGDFLGQRTTRATFTRTINFYLKTDYQVSLLEHSVFDYRDIEDRTTRDNKMLESLNQHKQRIQNLIKGI